MSSEQEQANKVEVRVGPYDERGAFLGEVVRFSGEEVGTHVEYLGEVSNRDDRGSDYTLYRCGEDSYRVLVEHWSRWQGEGSAAHLFPNSAEDDPYADDPDYGRPVHYTTYTEAQARAAFPRLFAALGMANVRDLD